MVRKFFVLACGVLFSVAVIGCGGNATEIKPEKSSAVKVLDESKQKEIMKESMEKMPPEIRAKMNPQMMEKMMKASKSATETPPATTK